MPAPEAIITLEDAFTYISNQQSGTLADLQNCTTKEDLLNARARLLAVKDAVRLLLQDVSDSTNGWFDAVDEVYIKLQAN